MIEPTYYVYVLASLSRTIYIGVTSDLVKRVYEHREKAIPGFTQKYNIYRLVYFETFGDISAAIAREKN
jgi:putative endonuclease